MIYIESISQTDENLYLKPFPERLLADIKTEKGLKSIDTVFENPFLRLIIRVMKFYNF